MSEKEYFPLRTCIGCGKKSEKQNFIKIVKSKDGKVFIDADNGAWGRGAYVCADISCVLKAEKKKKLSRSLKLNDCESIYEKLKKITGEKNGKNI